MPAECARNESAQDGTHAQRCTFPKGSRAGHLDVLEDAKWNAPKVLVRCAVTGKTLHLAGHTLAMHRRGVSKTCPLCNQRQKVWHVGEASNTNGRHCAQCADLPHRRPKIGKCKCGKRFEAQAIAIDLDDRRPGNLARSMGVTRVNWANTIQEES